jgi:tetratricopeptide (TPR) repeat protein
MLQGAPGLVSALAERLVSQKAFAVGFVLLALLFTAAGWLRPPLNRDVDSWHIPWGIWGTGSLTPEEILSPLPGGRGSGWRFGLVLDSPGVLVLGLLGVGLVVVFVSPRRVALLAGLLLCAALAGNAAVALNHPAVVELMDLENQQRQGMGEYGHQWQQMHVLTEAKELALTTTVNSRVPPEAHGREEWADLVRGWLYLLYGKGLVLVAVIGLLLASQGSLGRRLAITGAWSALAVCLAVAVCWPRVEAEYYWVQATRLETQGDHRGARQALRTAVDLFPEFARLERTWLLAGKADYREQLRTPQEQFFQAYQFGHRATDDRAHRVGLALLGDLKGGAGNCPAVRNRAATLWSSVGLEAYAHSQFIRALTAWQEAGNLVPQRFDSAFCKEVLLARLDSPGRLPPVPHLDRMADHVLRADRLANLGNAYFGVGEMHRARHLYEESVNIFNLPKEVNFNAEKGLGGL